jgi:hypothetical protein
MQGSVAVAAAAAAVRLAAADASCGAGEIKVVVVRSVVLLVVDGVEVARLDQPTEAVHAPPRLLECVERVEHLVRVRARARARS